MKKLIFAALFSAAILPLFAEETKPSNVIWDFKLAERKEFFQNNGLPPGISYVKDGDRNVFQYDSSVKGAQCAVRYLDPKKELARTKGKTLRLSIKAKGENLKSKGGSVKFMLMVGLPKKTDWPQANIPTGTYGWKEFKYTYKMPADAKFCAVILGLQGVSGKVRFKDMEIRIVEPVGYEKETQLKIEPDRKNGIYNAGETAKFKIIVLDKDKKAVEGRTVLCTVKNELTPIRQIKVISGKNAVVEQKIGDPRSIQVSAVLLDKNNDPALRAKNQKIVTECGAFFSPEKLVPGAKMPADFDTFWNAQKALLKKVPMNAKLVLLPDNPKTPQLQTYDVTLACPGGKPVRAYMTLPKNAKPKSLPALVTYHAYGVRSASRGGDKRVLQLDVNAHGIENGKPAAYYRDMERKLGWYPASGKEDREKFYFHGMYLRALRALEFVKSRPEWNGKVLMVTGGSQGGGQAIAMAGLDHDVTLLRADVPALSDHAGAKMGRRAGWPGLYRWTNGKADNPKAEKTAEYYDGVNFARRIQCESWITTGFIDNICSPSGPVAVYNTIPVKNKHLVTNPYLGHGHGWSPEMQRRIDSVLSGK